MAYQKAVIARGWTPHDTAAKAKQENLMTHTYVKALRQLAPDMGAYINEVRNVYLRCFNYLLHVDNILII